MTGCIVLAAGAARRMGRLKQLLPFEGSTLVQHAVEQAKNADLSPVVVVLGACAEEVAAAVAAEDVFTVHNMDWEMGMGSSLTAGLSELLKIEPRIDVFGVVLADQPLVRAAHLQQMASQLSSTGCDVVAAAYNDTLGAPAFFSAKTFASVRELSPEAGAKKLFSNPAWTVHPFALEEAAKDIDTPEDFANLVPTSKSIT